MIDLILKHSFAVWLMQVFSAKKSCFILLSDVYKSVVMIMTDIHA